MSKQADTRSAEIEARIDELKKTVEICEGVIESWSKHAYSMEAFANDTIVMSGKGDKSHKDRHNDDVTDRRAILLTSAIPKHLKERISELKATLEKEK